MTRAADLDELQAFTLAQLARILPTSRTTLWRACMAGEIPYFRVRGVICVSREWLDEMLATARVERAS